ncbi:MAG TPA: hypothetical protein VLF40_03025 [Candidatus Saccharimonadales bacterium]|nr:hypothetical protein [Candidatus Saccharimonadales bacterium]
MYKLKNVAKRGSALLGAVGLLAGIGTSALPAFASADALNPLTERSLTLSSSSPGWSYLDGSGNTLYAPPHSGANGQKTGETFSFRFSSFSKTIKAATFQFCTTPAGTCVSPGDNGHNVINKLSDGTPIVGATADITSGSAAVVGTNTLWDTAGTKIMPGATIKTPGGHTYTVLSVTDDTHLTLTANAGFTETGIVFGYENNNDTTSTSDLNVVTASPAESTGLQWTAIQAAASKTPLRDNSQGNFVVLHENSTSGPPVDWSSYTLSSGWTMTKSNSETGDISTGDATAKNNLITLKNAGGQALTGTTGDYWKIIFFGTDTNYITNPGSGAFFVRMNSYNDDTTLDDNTLVDGGVTVANVMNESITIQTKVLETMDFSVGVKDPDTFNDSVLTPLGLPAHGQCNTLLMADPTAPGVVDATTYNAQPHNVLKLGDANAEYSLKTSQAYTVDSYWRLSSNSSGGATVYYTGHTLTNTENDQITPMNDTTAGGTASVPGTEQFGLGIAQTGAGVDNVNHSDFYNVTGDTYGTDNGNNATYNGDYADFVANGPSGTGYTDFYAHTPRLYPLDPDTVANHYGHAGDGTPKYAFNAHADTYAIPIASENTDVVNCVTAKMRYIANIAATTPAGIYTTKINYVASPQY